MYRQDIKHIDHPASARTERHRKLSPSRAHGHAPKEKPDSPRRIWTINGDFIGLRPTGVARYAREVTQALDSMIADHHPLTGNLEIELVTPRHPPEDFVLRSIPVRVVPEFSKPRLPQFWVQAQLPRHVRGGLLSFCNLAPVAIAQQIVCIHDLHTRIMPESYGRAFRWAHRAILPMLGKRVAAITTVSRFSRAQLIDYDVAPASKITVAYNGSDHVTRWRAERSSLKRHSRRPYVLCLGQSQKYKNAELLIRVAPMLDALGIDIWMAGDIAPSLIEHHANRKLTNLRLLGRISDDDFKKALSKALCFLFPSRIEGFGLPAAEAMAAGCPVVASTAPCIPEICGDAALYASPDDPAAWATMVRRINDDPALRQRMIDAGQIRALGYSWKTVAETYLKLMRQIDAEYADPVAYCLEQEAGMFR
ncbi:MAG: glycosyltransferase family 4 protein [Phyllobacterium sp.]